MAKMNQSQKIEKLLEIKSALIKEIYRQCLRKGIDPDTFDYQSYTDPTTDPTTQASLGAHCFKLKVIESKLKELQ